MSALSAIFALLVAAAGWYYAFYSTAAARLGEIESQPSNLRRVRLRRVNGSLMILLGGAFYVTTSAIEQSWSARTTALLLLVVLVLLLAVGLLALIDLRMTNRLQRQARDRRAMSRQQDESK